MGVLKRIILLFPGRSTGVSQANATSRYPHTTLDRSDKSADDWHRECEKHRRTLNGTRFASSGTPHQEPERPNWPCVDNTSCEIQLSLVEQQQKLLNQKKQTSTKLQTSLHTGLRNGHNGMQMHSAHSLDNRPLDDKSVSRLASAIHSSAIHSKSQQDFTCGTVLHRGVGSHNGWTGSVDMNSNNQDRVCVLAHKAPSDVHANPVVPGRKHAGEHEFDASVEQMSKKQKRLQHLQGSRKSGKLHRIFYLCIAVQNNCNK